MHPVVTRPVLRGLILAGWLMALGEIGFLIYQLDRVREVTTTPFGVWDQRLEILSFLVLPPNVAALAPAVGVAAATCLLAGERADRDPWLVMLLRLVAGLAVMMVVIGAASLVSMYTSDAGAAVDIGSVFLRLGGMAMAAGMFVLCRTADVASD